MCRYSGLELKIYCLNMKSNFFLSKSINRKCFEFMNKINNIVTFFSRKLQTDSVNLGWKFFPNVNYICKLYIRRAN